jgi:hypothetical protein
MFQVSGVRCQITDERWQKGGMKHHIQLLPSVFCPLTSVL